jgi:integrase/recombinase XerD
MLYLLLYLFGVSSTFKHKLSYHIMATTVKAVLKKEKINKVGEAPVYLRITKDRKSRFVAIGVQVKLQNWDEGQGRVKKGHPNMVWTNAFITQKVAEANGVALDLQMESKFVPAVQIKKAIMGQSSESFLVYFTRYLTTLEKRGKMGTLDKATAVYSKLKAYLGKSDLLFDEMTVSFLKQYEAYLRDELGNSVNTIHSNLKIFRKLINDAIQEDLVSPARNPFVKFKLKLEKTEKAFLTEEELEAVWALALNEKHKIWHHRNLFIFAAYAGGLRISDLLQLRWENVSGTHVRVTMHKTGDVVSVKLPTRALEILQMYRKPSSKGADRVFPLIREGVDPNDARDLFKAMSSATVQANKDLKTIAERAGITKDISFHSSRHTFATRALTKGMAIEHVSKLLGHASIKTTQIYAKIVNEELDRAMDVFN